ncbi:DUF5994 family protein [Streptomyces griseoviridis]|uniref:Uncharacterized protein n=1 Tax=Streptomyces griseoviridis TaxID=45398 RepID=A0A3S9ZDV1_STRGD|nr:MULTISPECIES: DUF5994 family protein [Streptomyces]AZS86034.1 hypothetical protein ELQ87_18415 [Streptomyces griseoviridis]MDH6702812.1 hypothetical protein [Streptomyces sp. MAA16]QCN87107.1 hypothetical protein DDJ31_20865 [Streptomyces griseoviridis]
MTLAPPPSGPVPTGVRLRLAAQPPHGRQARRIDGAWWPRSHDLMAELTALLGGLPRDWGHISSVVVNGGGWSDSPGRMFVAGQVVRLRRTESPRAADSVCLLAPGLGRWDLLVVSPDAGAAEAGELMAAGV